MRELVVNLNFFVILNQIGLIIDLSFVIVSKMGYSKVFINELRYLRKEIRVNLVEIIFIFHS